MKVLILGSTGMLGQRLKIYFETQNIEVQGIARSNADVNMDIVKEFTLLEDIIEQNQYDIVINTIALINLVDCENNPERAYLVNTYVPGKVAEICDRLGKYFIQISTDHFYTDHKNHMHTELDKIVLLNEYAKTKYLAEKLVEIYPNTLIIRTNIVGYRNNKVPTFVEWIINALNNDETITGFIDMYASSIDVSSLSHILYQLIQRKATGMYNVSADGVISKFEFIQSLATKFGKEFLVEEGYLTNNAVKRGNSLGLSLEKLKKEYPEITIPTVYAVVNTLYEEYVNNN